MQILVTVKQVATVGDDFAVDGVAVDERDVTYELNEWDEYALEAAVQLAEERDDVEVVTATVGPERTEETIRQALAKGADRAVRVWDETIAEAPALDPGVKATLLSAVARQEDPDLVLTGVQSGDDSLGATGVTMAERLGYAWAAVVNELSLSDDGAVAHVHRELEGGMAELTEVSLPAVLTIQTGINDPRYASLRGIRQAQGKELAVLTLADLDVDAGALASPIEQIGLSVPESESEAVFFEGDPSATAADLATVLREEGVGE